MSERDDELYLQEMIEAATAALATLSSRSRDEFMADTDLRELILFRLIRIGEGASRLTPELLARYPTIPWRQMAAMRHRAVHAYFSVDWSIVWKTAQDDLPELLERLHDVRDTEYPRQRSE